MKKIFLTSNLGCSYKVDGIRYPKTINNVNGIIEQLKENLKDEGTLLFFCSDPSDYEKNDNYAKVTFERTKLKKDEGSKTDRHKRKNSI